MELMKATHFLLALLALNSLFALCLFPNQGRAGAVNNNETNQNDNILLMMIFAAASSSSLPASSSPLPCEAAVSSQSPLALKIGNLSTKLSETKAHLTLARTQASQLSVKQRETALALFQTRRQIEVLREQAVYLRSITKEQFSLLENTTASFLNKTLSLLGGEGYTLFGKLTISSIYQLQHFMYFAISKLDGDLTIEINSLGDISNVSVITFPSLRLITGSLTIQNCVGLTSVEFPALEEILGGSVSVFNSTGLAKVALPVLRSITTGSISVLKNPELRDVAMPLLTTLGGSVTYRYNPAMLTLSFAGLKTLLGPGVIVAYQSSLRSVRFDSLVRVQGTLHVENSALLEEIAFPKLESVGYLLYLNNLQGISTIDFPMLDNVTHEFAVYSNSKLQSLSFPKLRLVERHFIIRDNPLLLDIYFPSLTTVGSESDFSKYWFLVLKNKSLQSIDSLCTSLRHMVNLDTVSVCSNLNLTSVPSCLSALAPQSSNTCPICASCYCTPGCV